jgi:hypothetical protein
MLMALLTSSIALAEAGPTNLLRGDWKPIASDGVRLDVVRDGGGLRIDFDFTGGAGFGGAVLDLPIDLPENYAFDLVVRGDGPANNLELKLVDPTLLNVWWVNWRRRGSRTASGTSSSRGDPAAGPS